MIICPKCNATGDKIVEYKIGRLGKKEYHCRNCGKVWASESLLSNPIGKIRGYTKWRKETFAGNPLPSSTSSGIVVKSEPVVGTYEEMVAGIKNKKKGAERQEFNSSEEVPEEGALNIMGAGRTPVKKTTGGIVKSYAGWRWGQAKNRIAQGPTNKIGPFKIKRLQKVIIPSILVLIAMMFIMGKFFPFSVLGIGGIGSPLFWAAFAALWWLQIPHEYELRADAEEATENEFEGRNVSDEAFQMATEFNMRGQISWLWIKGLMFAVMITGVGFEIFRLYPFGGLVAIFLGYFSLPSSYRQNEYNNSILSWIKMGMGQILALMVFLVFAGEPALVAGWGMMMIFLTALPLVGILVGWGYVMSSLTGGLFSPTSALGLALYFMTLAFFVNYPTGKE